MDASLSKKIGILRFAAVVTVVAYHAYPPGWPGGFAQGFVSLGLARWALPFLGLVSGYLFFRTFAPSVGGYVAKLRSRVRTVLVPFLFWSGIALGVAWVTASPEFQGPITSPADALYHWLVRPCASPLWFLQALMTCIVLSPLVWLTVRTLRWWALALAVVWWVTGFQPQVVDPWVSPVAFPPFIAGAAVAMLRPRLEWARRPAPAWVLTALAGAWVAAAALFAGYGVGLGPWTRAAMLPAVVLGVLVVWLGYDALRPLLQRAPGLVAAAAAVAPLSFFVYATQQPQLKAIMLALGADAAAVPGLAGYLLAPLLAVTCSLLAGLVWRRISPRTFRVVSGGRVGRRPVARRDRTAEAPAHGKANAPGVVRVPGATAALEPAVADSAP